MTATSLMTLGDSDFVALTTFRRSGEAVPTPVWVVPDGNRLALFTPPGPASSSGSGTRHG